MYVHVCAGTYAHVWTCVKTKGVIPQESFTFFCEVGSLRGPRTRQATRLTYQCFNDKCISGFCRGGGDTGLISGHHAGKASTLTSEPPSPALKAAMTKNHTTVTESDRIQELVPDSGAGGP